MSHTFKSNETIIWVLDFMLCEETHITFHPNNKMFKKINCLFLAKRFRLTQLDQQKNRPLKPEHVLGCFGKKKSEFANTQVLKRLIILLIQLQTTKVYP